MSERLPPMRFLVGDGQPATQRRIGEDYAMDSKPGKLTANEVLVFDSSTFVREAGLTSSGASALKHYLFRRGTQLAVPEVAVKECERHLAGRATGKVKSAHAALSWLARFCGEVSGWKLPRDVEIAERVQAAAPPGRHSMPS